MLLGLGELRGGRGVWIVVGGGKGLERSWGFGDVGPALGLVVKIHLFAAAFFAQGADHGLDVFRAEKRVRAEGAGADAFFYADDFAAVEAVGRGG